MTRPEVWRIYGVAVVSLALVGWAGMASAAAKWANPELLVTPEEVKANVAKPDWVVVDCRDLEDYAKGHIPGAISFGKKCRSALRDSTSRIFMDVSKYENFLGKVGIGNDTHVILYHGDIKTITDVGVAFWILEYLGHEGKVHVLNGGLDAWRKAGNRLDNQPVIKSAKTFTAKVVPARYSPTSEVLEVAQGKQKNMQLVDSRTEGEYEGKDIRAIRGGYVPNTTMNKSHIDTLMKEKDPKTGKMKPVAYFDPEETEKAFGSLDKNKRTVAYCQTGTRSAMTYLQLRLLGFKDPANWDESWRVYGSQLTNPVANEQWYNFAGVNNKIKALEKKISELEKKK